MGVLLSSLIVVSLNIVDPVDPLLIALLIVRCLVVYVDCWCLVDCCYPER